MGKVVVVPLEPEADERARQLAKALRLPLSESAKINDSDLFLQVSHERVQLQLARQLKVGPVYVDFLSADLQHRRRFGLSKNQLLARAMGLSKAPVSVLDATAGLGKDSFFLACLGARVTGVEKSQILFALLEDGYQRALSDPEVGAILKERLTIHQGDSVEFMRRLSGAARPDVVYLDPMFPEKKKASLSPKEMQVFQLLLGQDQEPVEELLHAALQVAKDRVVVKRPLRSSQLPRKPHHSFRGKSIRYDMFLAHSHSKDFKGESET